MRSKAFCLLMAAMLGGVPVPMLGSPKPRTEYQKPVPQSVIDRERAYTEKRWVGMLRKGIDRCPGVEGWESAPLLDLARLAAPEQDAYGRQDVEIQRADRILLRKLGLDRYCVYTQKDPATAFRRPRGLVAVEKDRLALSITSAGATPSGALGRRIWPALAKNFRSQTGKESATGSPLLSLKGPQSVRLTFIDSQPDEEGFPLDPLERDAANSQHGFTLAHLARDLVCPSSDSCAATIATRRALSFQRFDSKAPFPPPEQAPNRSGHVGLVSNLATAIIAEVLYWRWFEPDKKLIINLSLGWDGESFGDLEARKVSKLEPSVRAVYNALRFARRSGALVIAASGNLRGGSEPSTWPLLPAAWELRRPNCLRLPWGRKPVYAVGGVDWQGLPVPNSRPGGRPRRVAYADHSVTHIQAPHEPTAMYTGTSVSAAVASSIAAVVWHLRPDLKPSEVMKLVLRSGDVLDSRADFYAWKGLGPISKLVQAPPTQRLSLCPAVALACGQDGRRCPNLASLATCPPWSPKPLELGLGPDIDHLTGPAAEARPPQTTPLEQLVDIASQRWVFPQPDAPPCPDCTVVSQPPPSSNFELMLEISDSWQAQAENVTIESATLVIEDANRSRRNYDIPLTSRTHGVIHRIPIQSGGRPLMGSTAYILFKVKKMDEGPMSIINPVFVAPAPF